MTETENDALKTFYQPGKAASLYPNLRYIVNATLDAKAVSELYRDSGLNRPVDDVARIKQMLDNSNLIISVWDGDLLVGIARSLTDFVYCCYLSDLAVRKSYQKGGIGKELLRRTKEVVGDKSNLMLLAADSAMEYYPKVGMIKMHNGFIVNRLL